MDRSFIDLLLEGWLCLALLKKSTFKRIDRSQTHRSQPTGKRSKWTSKDINVDDCYWYGFYSNS